MEYVHKANQRQLLYQVVSFLRDIYNSLLIKGFWNLISWKVYPRHHQYG